MTGKLQRVGGAETLVVKRTRGEDDEGKLISQLTSAMSCGPKQYKKMEMRIIESVT